MKRILYFTPRDVTDTSTGINKKIMYQIEELRKSFYVDAIYRKNDCELVLQKNDGTEKVLTGRMRRPYKVEASRGLCQYLERRGYDGFYIRYVFADSQFVRALKKMKQQWATVIVEIPTYPYKAELSDTLENRIVLLLDTLYRRRMKPYVDKIVTYSKDKAIHGIPAMQVINGVDFRKISVAEHDEEEETVNMIAVANLAVGHGYDRLLAGMGQYYAKGGQRDVHFYQVGAGKQVEEYRKLAEKYKIQDKVTFCGTKSGRELDELYDKCTLAIEVLAPHRQGIKLSSSLKSREYAAKGLPMVTAVDIDIFEGEGCSYVKKICADESPVDLEEIIRFYDGLYGGESKNGIAGKVREYARKLCDIDVVTKPVTRLFED